MPVGFGTSSSPIKKLGATFVRVGSTLFAGLEAE
jgi:uncharacterized pyridoxal phosphate-containing UPF0001 family protein